MRLYELDTQYQADDEELQTEITAVLSKLKDNNTRRGFDGSVSVKSLLGSLMDEGINITRRQLLDAYKDAPWSNFIADINDEEIVFKGDSDEDTETVDPEQTTDTMKTMADRSANTHADELAEGRHRRRMR
jgi:hypothetical protein